MLETVEALDPRQLTSKDLSIFLDFDGTLTEIADHPSMVLVDHRTKGLLTDLVSILDGALAIVSGRPIAEIDDVLTPLRLPVAGVHGFERRDAADVLHTAVIDEDAVAMLSARLERFAAQYPGLLVETKPGAVALHDRACPTLEERCLAAMRKCIDTAERFTVLHGKMVVEAKAGNWNKADAIAAFMGEVPFKGRLPVFAGDDVTDETAFEAVAGLHGITVKVGPGESRARYRAPTTARFIDWLARLAAVLADGETSSDAKGAFVVE